MCKLLVFRGEETDSDSYEITKLNPLESTRRDEAEADRSCWERNPPAVLLAVARFGCC